jgi:hypothetical protein
MPYGVVSFYVGIVIGEFLGNISSCNKFFIGHFCLAIVVGLFGNKTKKETRG